MRPSVRQHALILSQPAELDLAPSSSGGLDLYSLLGSSDTMSPRRSLVCFRTLGSLVRATSALTSSFPLLPFWWRSTTVVFAVFLPRRKRLDDDLLPSGLDVACERPSVPLSLAPPTFPTPLCPGRFAHRTFCAAGLLPTAACGPCQILPAAMS